MHIFICSKCGAQFLKWSGKCTECDAWGTVDKDDCEVQTSESVSAIDLSSVKAEQVLKIKTNIKEIDRVLGNGIVPGSLILLGGDPGIGKSTLALQMADKLKDKQVIYISGEESMQQIKLRMDRLGMLGNNLKFLPETEVSTIVSGLKKYKPAFAVIDSMQTIRFSQINSDPGSVSQVKAGVAELVNIARKLNIAILIIGHVTKEGVVAGPKTLEHLVDVVLYFEGDKYHYFRFLRATKNRFGSTNEIGVFEMGDKGLEQVKNPSESFLANRDLKISGSVVSSIIKGTRSFLIEVQSLVSQTSFGYAQRKSSGFDLNRLSVLVAVLTKRCNINLYNKDIHINVVGGLQANEPATDLSISLAIVSALKNKPIDPNTVIFGEVGLGGEIRPVPYMEKRIKEASNLGFKKVICPVNKTIKSDIKITQVKNLSQVIKLLF